MKELFHNPPFGLVLAVTAIAAIIIFAILRLADMRRINKSPFPKEQDWSYWKSQAKGRQMQFDQMATTITELKDAAKAYEDLCSTHDQYAKELYSELRESQQHADTLKAELAKKDRKIKRLQNMVDNQRKYANY